MMSLKVKIYCLVCCALLGGCLYKLEVQQGNIIEADSIERLAVGMTTRQVIFLLGNPILENQQNQNQWHYVYYVDDIEANDIVPQRLSVTFEDGIVTEIVRSNITN